MEFILHKLRLIEVILTNEGEHKAMRLDLIRMVDIRQSEDG